MKVVALLRLGCLAVVLFQFGSITSAKPQTSPFDDAVAVWHMADTKDSANKNSDLKCEGDLSLGVELAGDEKAASLARDGDGKVAEFRGGYLNAGQGIDGELNLSGKSMTMCMRFRLDEGIQDAPLFSKHGGHKSLVYNLFCTDLGSWPSLGFELGTEIKVMQKGIPFVTYINKCSVKSGHYLFDFPQINITYRELNIALFLV